MADGSHTDGEDCSTSTSTGLFYCSFTFFLVVGAVASQHEVYWSSMSSLAPAGIDWSPSSLYKHVYLLQVSDQISVMLRSGTSATLTFRWNKSRADILLPVVAAGYQPEARVGGKSGRRC